MDEQRRPRSREKKVINDGKGVEKRSDGLGTGPVNNTGNYQDRREQHSTASSPFFGRPQRPAQGQNPYAQRPTQQGNPFSQQRPPKQGQGFPFGTSQHSDSGTQRPSTAGREKRQYHSAERQNGTGMQRSSGTGGGKILLVIIVLALLFGGGKLGGLFDSVSSYPDEPITQQNHSVTSSQQNQFSVPGSGLGDLGNLLNAFLGSGGSSPYDLSSLMTGTSGTAETSGTFESLISSQNGSHYFTSSADDNSAGLDESVSKKAREKYTVVRGNSRDTVTILIYMCGTDLESQQGMATSDLKEMANATIGEKVNLLIYTGGCRRWRNNVISSDVNQIYRISDGKFECLVKDAGRASMVNPETLVSFIEFGGKNYPADRMCLIFWDHGGGSVSGYGYDEKIGHGQSMTLAGINSALKKADVKFDFIGFDACLMATVENGLMLAQYADYMIASEETEPGVGWYYTNWLTNLSRNTSMPTIQIGKQIADDFVAVCDRQCRGQATTLSVVDLAELQATIPDELKKFSIDTNELIQNKEYKKVATARSKTREFAQQTRIDQIDLVDFARNLKTAEGESLAKALQGSVKYNKTGGSITHAYGLSIYFPQKRASKVNQMVSTYQAIGMDEEYTRCIQEFASLEVSGQVSAGTPISGYGSNQNASPNMIGSLLGQGGGYSSYTAGGLEELLGGLYGGNGGGTTGSILDLFIGRSMTADDAAEYILNNHFDASALVWKDRKITLPSEQWDMITDVVKNVFYDDGSGFIDLGTDADFTLSNQTLSDDFDGTWLSIDGQPVAYYYLNTIDDGEQYVIYGYVPAILNGERVNLILNFDSERPYGYIAGAMKAYTDGESDTQAKMMIAIGKGDKIQFLCDYYDYDGNYRDSYRLGDPITLGSTVEIANTPIASDLSRCRVTYRLTDIYQQHYWTPTIQ